MCDAGLAERLHDLVGGMFKMELAKMFGGYGFLMNGHMCVFIWGDRLVIRIGEASANGLPSAA
jgi:TfoX/Sxy family transcriptional regulator of competence genes